MEEVPLLNCRAYLVLVFHVLEEFGIGKFHEILSSITYYQCLFLSYCRYNLTAETDSLTKGGNRPRALDQEKVIFIHELIIYS